MTKPINQEPDTARYMFFDRILGDSHLSSYFTLRKAFDTPQDEGFTRFEWHRRDRYRQPSQLVAADSALFWRWSIVGIVEPLQIVDGLDRHDLRAPDVTYDQRAGNLEQIGLGKADRIDRVHFCEDRVGFLDDVIDIDADHSASDKPAAQRRLMRQNMPQEPARSLPI
ncbi:hypothetical protein A7Q26_04970 [Sphingobium sp. TCM1]|uniref:Uncharacterized protein n=1 Tax=Sphingomonas sanxanigenens DSM 19645 = NX02 TaxID=1123269 RepID=W0ABA8_9SPHN|nr:hypothetical protein NX02_09335 [Sphingomonas sanxanigenens DSM 19645 = NX02]OAN53382.1 hypothetical protein A7Q26_04970 [Sphingobium sp. TCM1]